MKKALITGIAGQDGSYLAEYLLTLGYQVTGLVRYEANLANNLTPHVRKAVRFLCGDLRDKLALEIAIHKTQPDEIYNLAGQSFVPPSWTLGEETFDVNVGGVARILAIAKRVCPHARIYQASSSEMFGNTAGPLTKGHVMEPKSPYGASKLAAHHLIRMYRETGTYAVGGILFNHESPRRGPEMVTRKIVQAVAQWKLCKESGGRLVPLKLGNLDARRDWGFAGDYVKAMHKMLQQREPEDYVIGTGVSHSVFDFINAALDAAGLTGWIKGAADLIQQDPQFVRNYDIYELVADTEEFDKLGWQPEVSFSSLVKMMVDAEFEHMQDIRGQS